MNIKGQNKGFTLVEILVAVSIFAIILTMISGLFSSALKAQRRSLALQELLAETSYVMEYMSRHIRMAQIDMNATCGPGMHGNSYGVDSASSSLIFKSYKDVPNEECWIFYLDDNSHKLMLEINGVSQPLTSDNLYVEDFSAQIEGQYGLGVDSDQPRVTITLKVRVIGGKPEEQPSIILQTTLSQRNLDVPF